SLRKVEDIDDNGDGKSDRTVYQMMANYQSTTNGGNGFMRFMECDPQNGTITMRTYSPYTQSFGSDYETWDVLDEYGYRDEFVIPFDFSAPSIRADGTNGTVVVTPAVSFAVTDSTPAVTLKLGYQNVAENGGSYQTAGVYDRFFSLNAADAFSSPRSLNYVTVTYREGSGYTVSKVTKGSSLSASDPYVPIPQDGAVIALTSGAVDINTLTVGRKVFLDRAPVIQAPSPIKQVTLRTDSGVIFNIDEINRSIGADQWVLYDDATKNIYSHEWNMLFAFIPVNGSRERFKVTQMNLESGVAKMLPVPANGFVVAINSYSAGECYLDSLLECLNIGSEVTLVGHAVGRPSAYNCQSFLPSSASGWSFNSSEAVVTDENGAQAIYKVSGQWPGVDYNFAYSMVIDPNVKALYYDYMSEADSKNNIMLFFKNSNATNYVSGEYISIQAYFEGANISTGSGDVKGDGVRRIGKIDFSKMDIPSTCYNDDGTLTINAIRVLASGTENKKLYLYDIGYTSEMNDGHYALPQAMSLMDPETITVGDSTLKGNYTYDSGRLTVESMTDSGFRLEFAPNKSFDVTRFKNWLIKANASVSFDIQLEVTTSGANANYGLVSEFAPAFGGATNGLLPAGNYDKSFELLGCYTWNNVLPADGITTVKKITIILGGKGTLTIDTLQMANSGTAGVFADGVQKQGGSSKIFETTYTVQNDTVSGVEVETTVSAFLSTVTSDFTVTVKENGASVSGNALVKTGQTIVVTADGNTLVSYTIIVKGDVDKNGKSSTADARALLSYAL
ncbi:MAG: hypothetical protein IKV35_02815, partial [Clostridia bacterium]|nr:hypothetical protein [Clostridia bacterium]